MIIDLRQIASMERIQLVLSRYQTLESGQALNIISSCSEQEILSVLQNQYAGEFEWYSLNDGPELWQMIVSKRSPNAPRCRQVLEFMETDHRRIYTMLDQLPVLVEQGARSELSTLLNQMATGLRKHIQMEEELLLPVIAERLVSPRGPAAVLRDDHIRVMDYQIQLQEVLLQAAGEKGWGRPLLAVAEAFRRFFDNHVGMEERILYAVTDLILNETERDALVQRCQILSAQ
jgi:uncharacterized protein (DUF2249 family)